MSRTTQDFGTSASIDAAVELFYRKALNDRRLNGFFHGIDVERQIERQKALLAMAFGGARNPRGPALPGAHRRLASGSPTDAPVDAVIELLGETLRELDVSPAVIGRIAEMAESVRNELLNGQPESVC